MSVTVRDLLGFPNLGLSVRAGHRGLDKVVTWAHVSEQDPSKSLSLDGGELLLSTGLGIPHSEADQVEYLRRLARRGASGLAVSRENGIAPPLTDRLLLEADRIAIPVLDIRVDVAFKHITGTVASANGQAGEQRLLDQLRILETLRTETGSSLPAQELFELLSQASGFRLFLSSPGGKPLLEGVPPVPDRLFRDLEGQQASRSIADGYSVSIRVAGRSAGYLVGLRRKHTRSTGFAGVQHIATVASVRLADLYRRREEIRRANSELFVRLLTDPPVKLKCLRLLAEAGFSDDSALIVGMVRSRTIDLDAQALHHQLCDLHIPSLILPKDDLSATVRAGDASALIACLDSTTAIGLSRPFKRGANMLIPAREAQWSLEGAWRADTQTSQFSPTDAAAMWLSMDPDLLRALVDGILAPALKYDETHRSRLVPSLRVFLDHDRRLRQAASELRIHPHTLAYRMKMFEKLTGKKLSRVGDLVEVWLALRAFDELRSDGKSRGLTRSAGRAAGAAARE